MESGHHARGSRGGGRSGILLLLLCIVFSPLLNFGANLYVCLFFLDIMYLQNTEFSMVFYLCRYIYPSD
jgi:hypothetical protein